MSFAPTQWLRALAIALVIQISLHADETTQKVKPLKSTPAEVVNVMPVAKGPAEVVNVGEEEIPSGSFYQPAALNRVMQQQPAPGLDPLRIASPSGSGSGRLTGLFGGDDTTSSLLSQSQRNSSAAPGSDVVLGLEGTFRATTDGGSLLGKSRSTNGIVIQQRTPIMSDPRIRGDRNGRLTASGSYWLPARQDLDTALSKIDSRIIQDMVVVKGPYAVRYGPGFDFVDFQLLQSPRFRGGYESYGSTSFEYKSNGEQMYGRTSIWGGSDDWGYRVGYGQKTGNDYRTGGGPVGSLPSSYDSRDLDVALGFDLSRGSRVEFTFIRQDQADVEFPGLVFDISALKMNGFELKYTSTDQSFADLVTAEGWYNETRFAGDTFGAGKNRQIPTLQGLTGLQPLGPPLGPPGHAITDVDSMSTGARISATWGQEDYAEMTIGADAIIVNQQLNDVEDPFDLAIFQPVPFNTPLNLPIPRSNQNDIGLFIDTVLQLTSRLKVSGGARADFVDSDARDFVPNLKNTFGAPVHAPLLVSELKRSGLDQSFSLWSIFGTAEFEQNRNLTWKAGIGYGERPPTLTELYTSGSFIGSIQPGLTRLEGDPQLEAEKRLQVDLGFDADYGALRFGMNGFYATIKDYITYDHIAGANAFGFVPGQSFQRLFYTNTDLATMKGFEAYGDLLLTERITLFALVSYVEGKDHTRVRPSRLADILRPSIAIAPGQRSVSATPSEDLPSIPPLESIIGIRFHDPRPDPRWGIEVSARIVDSQERVAASLSEQATPGFTVFNARSYAQLTDSILVVVGAENFGDAFYREHLDYRAGLGVFQPGANFYVSTQVDY